MKVPPGTKSSLTHCTSPPTRGISSIVCAGWTVPIASIRTGCVRNSTGCTSTRVAWRAATFGCAFGRRLDQHVAKRDGGGQNDDGDRSLQPESQRALDSAGAELFAESCMKSGVSLRLDHEPRQGRAIAFPIRRPGPGKARSAAGSGRGARRDRCAAIPDRSRWRRARAGNRWCLAR